LSPVTFSEGLAAVQLGSFKGSYGRHGGIRKEWGFLNHDGRWVIPAVFYDVGSFHEGIAPAFFSRESITGWGVIDRTGQSVVSPLPFTKVGEFRDGVALVYGSNARGFYIDHDGNKIIVPLGKANWPYSDGLTVVEQDERQLYIDKQGNQIALYMKTNRSNTSGPSLLEGLLLQNPANKTD